MIINLLKNRGLQLSLLMFVLILLTNFFNTGCLIYPVKITCLESFSWSIPLQEVSQMNNWYEQWSKGGAGPNFRVDNPEIYIQNASLEIAWTSVISNKSNISGSIVTPFFTEEFEGFDINKEKDCLSANDYELLRIAFSNTVKETNIMSFTNDAWQSGKPTTWSKHAYWIPSQFCEVNVLSAFIKSLKRVKNSLSFNNTFDYELKKTSNFNAKRAHLCYLVAIV